MLPSCFLLLLFLASSRLLAWIVAALQDTFTAEDKHTDYTYSHFSRVVCVEFHVEMECGSLECFGMGWGIAQLHYATSACTAARKR